MYTKRQWQIKKKIKNFLIIFKKINKYLLIESILKFKKYNIYYKSAKILEKKSSLCNN